MRSDNEDLFMPSAISIMHAKALRPTHRGEPVIPSEAATLATLAGYKSCRRPKYSLEQNEHVLRDRTTSLRGLDGRDSLRAHYLAGRYEDAARALDELIAKSAAIGYEPLDAELAEVSAGLSSARGHHAEARAAYQKALVHSLRLRQNTEAAYIAARLIGLVAWNLARPREARAFIPITEGLGSKGGREDAYLRAALGDLYDAEALLEAAEREYRAALAILETMDGSRGLEFSTLVSLANVLLNLDRVAEAESMHRALLEEQIRALGPEHPSTLVSRVGLALDLTVLGRHEEAEALHREAVAVAESSLGSAHPKVAWALENLGACLVAQRRLDEALEVLDRAVALKDALPSGPGRAYVRLHRADVHHHAQRDAEAAAGYREAIEIFLEHHGPRHHDVALARRALVRTLQRIDQHEEALQQLLTVLDIENRYHAPDHDDVATARSALGRSLGALGRYDEAETELRAAKAVLEARHGPEHNAVRLAQQRLDEVASARATKRSVGRPREAPPIGRLWRSRRLHGAVRR